MQKNQTQRSKAGCKGDCAEFRQKNLIYERPLHQSRADLNLHQICRKSRVSPRVRHLRMGAFHGGLRL